MGTSQRTRLKISHLVWLLSAVLLLAVLLLAVLWAAPAWADAPARDVRSVLQALGEARGFRITGLDRVEDGEAALDGGPLERQIEALLDGYNYLLFHGGNGGLEELRILGKAPELKVLPRPYVVKTLRQGLHHVVPATLIGLNARQQETRLMLDTGATTIVLPVSMAEALGYDLGKLKKGWSWTANGKIPVRRGRLDFVQVGNASARDVDVVFVADERLGKKMLLGMSFLGRFHLSIDDAANEITLMPK